MKGQFILGQKGCFKEHTFLRQTGLHRTCQKSSHVRSTGG